MQIKLTKEQREKLLEYYGDGKEGFVHKTYEGIDYREMNLYLSTVSISNDYLNVDVNIELFLKWHITYLYENGEVILEIPTVRLIRGSKLCEPNAEYKKFQEVLQTLSSDIYQIHQLLDVLNKGE